MTDAATLRDRLRSLACSAGGWGYTPGQPAHIEPTCMAMLALAVDPAQGDVIESGRSFLESCRQPDGSYRLERGRTEAVWGTALVAFTRAATGDGPDVLKPTASLLLGVKGRAVIDDPEVADMTDIDMSLVGWPWALETFSWVEPTAWACIALEKLGLRDHPRVRDGEGVLLDRAFDSGGVNYGNRKILGKFTDPIPGPTSLLLLALHNHSEHPRVRAACDYLAEQLRTTTDLQHLGFGMLALDGLGRDVGEFQQKLVDGVALWLGRSWANPFVPSLASAILGFDLPQHNPFRGPALSAEAVNPTIPQVAKPPLKERITSGVRQFLIRGFEGLRQPPQKSAVHIAKANAYTDDLTSILKQQFANFREQVPLAGKRVVLKPNLVEFHADKVINTDPRVIAAAIELCRSEGAAEVIVAEGPGHWRNVDYLVAESGLAAVLSKHKVPFVDLNHDEPVKTLNMGRLTGLEYLYLAKTIVSADVVISMPKLKTHHWAGVTLSLKNLFGTLPGICYGWPKNELHWRGIPQSIIDIALTHTPQLTIIDAIIGMEGDGPFNGTPRQVGALIMGHDLLAADATGARLMGFPAERIAHLALGASKRLGRLKEAEIEQLGEPIEKMKQQFQPPPTIDTILMPAPA